VRARRLSLCVRRLGRPPNISPTGRPGCWGCGLGRPIVGDTMPPKRETFDPVTLGHIRSHGCRTLLVYCGSAWCNHTARLEPDWLPDDAVLPALGRLMVCTACGLIGADVRPDWSQHTRAAAQGGAHRH
jgi:hypothetical protein